ncbi:MAG TPA: hypothetical protein VHT91_21015 [Kofleriaceae bacterium]|nr:hypothetical protein [Kofleriaceae bacterium]
MHVSGGFRGGVSVRFARPGVRPIFRPRVWVGGRWWWNSYWWWPRPYYYYYPESVPSYYGGSYYPVQPGVSAGVAPGAAVVARRQRPLPTLGFGVFAGGTSVNGMKDASEVGLLGRLRLGGGGLLLEAELAKDSFSGDVSTCQPNVPCTLVAVSGDRTDRRIGGSLIWELGAHNSFAPYLLAGGGVQQAKVTSGDFFGADFTTTQDYGEIGVGLRWALSRSLHLTADIRAGRRETIDSSQTVTPVARTINPPSGGPGNDTEDYTRARLAAVINF